MATITSVGSGNWSASGTWDVRVPLDGDDVVIAAGHTVTFDVDQSAWVTGLVGITVNGTLQASTSAGTYYMMLGNGTISGSGTLYAGTRASAYPANCKFTLAALVANKTISCIVEANCQTPSILYCKMTAQTNSGNAVLTVDTDVSAAWSVGDRVVLCNPKVTYAVEMMTIQSMTANSITLTSNLTAHKQIGTYVFLLTRNVAFEGLSASTPYSGIQSASSTVRYDFYLNAQFYRFGVRHLASSMIGGIQYPVTTSILVGSSISATLIGGAISSLNGCHFTGILAGAANGLYNSINNYINGKFLCNASAIMFGSGYLGAGTLFDGNTTDIQLAANSVGSYYGRYYGDGCGELTGTAAVSLGTGDGASGVWINNYKGISGAYKAWMCGGTVTTVTSQYPTGFTFSYLHALSRNFPVFWETIVDILPGQTLNFTAYFYKDASMTYLPRVWLSKLNGDPFNDAAHLLYESIMASDTNDTWLSNSCSYTNSTSFLETYVIRLIAKNATGNVYTQLNIAAGTGGGGIKNVPIPVFLHRRNR